MSFKNFINDFFNRNWEKDEILSIIVYSLIASFFVTPIIGIPIGIVIFYFLNQKN